MEESRISRTQALMLVISSITVTGHLLFIPVILNHASRDSWLSLLCAAVPALLAAYLTARLSQRFPGQSPVEYARTILGRWLGSAVSALFIFYLFHDATLSIRGFGEFFTSAITPRTPILVYMTAIIILAGYAVRSGIEVISRTNQMFLVMIIPVGILASILTHKDKDYRNFLPVLENGLQPVLMGALTLLSLYSTFIILGMLLPFAPREGRIGRASMATMLILVVMFLGPLTGPVAIFGAERSMGLSFPSFQILRDIKVGELQRLDLLGIMLWSMGSFSKIALSLFATCLGVSQWFGLKDYRVLALPVGSLMVIVSLLHSRNFLELYSFFQSTYPYYSTFCGLLLPAFLFGVAVLRRMRVPGTPAGGGERS
ncbi:spore germination protein KB [Paenibacillus mucilaginosus]|uniref:GerAB/ArcD/ProY family transporter n=1 Tax=Paenibacillus mucilaginosus TaxID=61624 RepID=UPI003D1B7DAE